MQNAKVHQGVRTIKYNQIWGLLPGDQSYLYRLGYMYKYISNIASIMF